MNIEELAFKNIEELEPEDELILYDIIDFLQKDRKQWINQYTKAHNDYVVLQQENQQLKEKYLNAVADYEYEKSKNQRAIEYINDLLLDFYDYECERLIVGKYMINDLLEMLKKDNKEKIDE